MQTEIIKVEQLLTTENELSIRNFLEIFKKWRKQNRFGIFRPNSHKFSPEEKKQIQHFCRQRVNNGHNIHILTGEMLKPTGILKEDPRLKAFWVNPRGQVCVVGVLDIHQDDIVVFVKRKKQIKKPKKQPGRVRPYHG